MPDSPSSYRSADGARRRESRARRVLAGIALLAAGVGAGLTAQSVGDRMLVFPKPFQEPLAAGPRPPLPPVAPGGGASEPLSEGVALVVIDGLGLAGLEHMPALRALGARGAHTVATTETPSYSQVGYSVLLTGARPEVSGVSSNDVQRPAGVDSLFQRARAAGRPTALVGYLWWLQLFGDAITFASFDGGDDDTLRAQGTPVYRRRPLPEGARRRVLDGTEYRDLDEDWDSWYWAAARADGFGNRAETAIDEEQLRAAEAARLWRRERPALLVLHLQDPDHWGHETGDPASAEYRAACAGADRALATFAAALDLSRQTLIVTADHGFTRTVIDGGHGGWEATATRVPLVLCGAGVRGRGERPEEGQRTENGPSLTLPARPEARSLKPLPFGPRHRDVAPTIAALLGLPFPAHGQGRPRWELLAAPAEQVARRDAHLAEAQERFARAYAEFRGLDLDEFLPAAAATSAAGGVPANTPADTPAITALDQAIFKARHLESASRRLHGLAIVLALALLVWPRPFRLERALAGVAAWLLFEALFFALFLAHFRVFSFSAASGSMALLRWTVGIALAAGVIAVTAALGAGAWRRRRTRLAPTADQRTPNPDGWAPRLDRVTRFLCLGAVLKSAIVFGEVGFGPDWYLPGGLPLFAAVIFHLQTLTVCVALFPLALLGRTLLARRG